MLERKPSDFSLSFFLSALLALTVLSIYFLRISDLPLFFDEAQYWEWAQHPSFGYYSKPPMIAWLITFSTSIFGDAEWAVRLTSGLLHTATALVIFFIARPLYGNRVAMWSALLYRTLPGVSVSSLIASTDPALMFFWAATVLLVGTGHWEMGTGKEGNSTSSPVPIPQCPVPIFWLLAGLSLGLGMLSKYSIVMLLPSVFLFLILSANHRRVLLTPWPWLACVIAFCVYAPNIFWNAAHGFVSFSHTRDNLSGNTEQFFLRPMEVLEFLAAQFAVFGPILFCVLLWLIIRSLIWFPKEDRERFWLLPILPMLAVVLVVSLLSRAHANWAVPIYVTGIIGVTAFLLSSRARVLVPISFILHLAIMILIGTADRAVSAVDWHYSGVRTVLSEHQLRDPFLRFRGVRELGEKMRDVQAHYSDAAVIVETRKLFVSLRYYGIKEGEIFKWAHAGVRDHYDLTQSFQTHADKKARYLFLTEDSEARALRDYFTQVREVEKFAIQTHSDRVLNYYVFLVEGAKDGEQ